MPNDDPKWYALWTHSNFEQIVHDQLQAKGFQPFLPTIQVWSRRRGRRLVRVGPMFPGYLFLRHAMDKSSYVEVVKSRGLVRVLGESWDRLAEIPDEQIETIRKVIDAQLAASPYPYLREGQRMRIIGGPLADVEGILVRSRPNKGLLVLAVDLLQRSVAVEVDCALVAAA